MTPPGTRCGRRCATKDVVLSIHLGSSDSSRSRPRCTGRRDDHASADEHLQRRIGPVVVAVIKAFPIRIALSEGGTGWIPYFLDRVDRTYEMHHKWTGQDFGGKLPSEVFREHFLTCFISDPIGVKLRREIGIDNIAWECDYPHSDSSWPSAPEELAASAPASRRTSSRRSPGEMRVAGTPLIRSRIGRGRGARYGHSAPRQWDTTCPYARTTRAASSEPVRAWTWGRSPRRQPPEGSRAAPRAGDRVRATQWHSRRARRFTISVRDRRTGRPPPPPNGARCRPGGGSRSRR